MITRLRWHRVANILCAIVLLVGARRLYRNGLATCLPKWHWLLQRPSSARCCPNRIPALNARPEEMKPSGMVASAQAVACPSLGVKRYSEIHRRSLRCFVRISSVPFGKSSELIIESLVVVPSGCRTVPVHCYLKYQNSLLVGLWQIGTVRKSVKYCSGSKLLRAIATKPEVRGVCGYVIGTPVTARTRSQRSERQVGRRKHRCNEKNPRPSFANDCHLSTSSE